MAIVINDNLQNNSPKSLDNKYTKLVGPNSLAYASVTEANNYIPIAYRSVGLTVLIDTGSGSTEYWYKNGVLDTDLVIKDNSNVLADNGLNKLGNTIKLGGTLLQNTLITGGIYRLAFTTDYSSYGSWFINSSTNTSSYASYIQSTGLGNALKVDTSPSASNVTGAVISGSGTDSIGVQGVGNPIGGFFQNVNSLSNNSVLNIVKIFRSHIGTVAAGIGSSIDYHSTVNGAPSTALSNSLQSYWSDAASATRTSEFLIKGVNNAVTKDALKLTGRGELVLGDDLTPDGTSFLRVNKTTSDYVPAFVVEETGSADNYILGQFKGKSNQLYVTTTQDDASLIFNDAVGNNYLIIGSTPSLQKAWIRTENSGGPLDFETNAGTIRTRMNQTGDWAFTGRLVIGTVSHSTIPTAKLEIGPGTAVAGTAPIKLNAGTNLTTVENGTLEYTTNELSFSKNSTRYAVSTVLKGSATLDFPSTAAGAVSDLTITVTGAADGDCVKLGVPNAATSAGGVYTAWVSAANTVKVRFYNNSGSAIDPISATFKVSVEK